MGNTKAGMLVSFAIIISLFLLSFAMSAAAEASWGKTASRPSAAGLCSNEIQDQDEEGVDCGGFCAKPLNLEICDGLDNDADCKADEEGVCDKAGENQQQGTQTSTEIKPDISVCAMPRQRTGDEDQPGANIIMAPRCVIASDVAGLEYRETINLTKMLNSIRRQTTTIPGFLAVYQGESGRCSAMITEYQTADDAKSALAEGISGVSPEKIGSGYANVNETMSVAAWTRGSQVIIISPYYDYTSGRTDKQGCTALFAPYMEGIGSDLLPAGAKGKVGQQIQESLATKLARISRCKIGQDGERSCEEITGTVIAEAPEPDENGMIMQCEYLDEKGDVACKKVNAAGFTRGTPGEESMQETTTTPASATDDSRQAAEIRRIAQSNGITVKGTDEELLRKLNDYRNAHSKEIMERHGGKDTLTEKEAAEEIRMFSEEESKKAAQQSQKPQEKSIFRKVIGFVKGLFS